MAAQASGRRPVHSVPPRHPAHASACITEPAATSPRKQEETLSPVPSTAAGRALPASTDIASQRLAAAHSCNDASTEEGSGGKGGALTVSIPIAGPTASRLATVAKVARRLGKRAAIPVPLLIAFASGHLHLHFALAVVVLGVLYAVTVAVLGVHVQPVAKRASPSSPKPDLMPSWVLHPDYERVIFINSLVRCLWPMVRADQEPQIIAQLNAQLRTVVDNLQPPLLADLTVSELSLGSLPPQILAVKSLVPEGESEFMLDMQLRIDVGPKLEIEATLAGKRQRAAYIIMRASHAAYIQRSRDEFCILHTSPCSGACKDAHQRV